MGVLFGIFMWLNAWAADRAFRQRRFAWAFLCSAVSVTCFVLWLRIITQ